MSGAVTPLGIVSVGAALPGMAELEDLAAAAQALARAELQGSLDGAVNVTAALTIPDPPGLEVIAAAQVAAQLAADVSISAPTLQIAGNAALVATLELALQGLTLPDFGLGAAGVAAYKFEGTIDSLAPGLGAHTNDGLPGGSGADVGYAVVLVATAPAAVAALKRLLIG
jgi:hypothetical protein